MATVQAMTAGGCPQQRRSLVARIAVVLLAALLMLPPGVMAVEKSYGYPLPGFYEATILGTPAKMKPEITVKVRHRQLYLQMFSDLEKPAIFFYDKGLRCTLAYQKHRAPLVFLIAGTGSTDQSPAQVTLMNALFQAGFHVITISSPTSPNFVISGSRSHIPGDMEEDAEDLYRVMEAAWDAIKNDIQVSDFHLSGYSLGGTQAAFVAKLDEERHLFNFRRVLMVNPAVNVYTSALMIEKLLGAIPGGAANVGRFFNSMLQRFSEFYTSSSFSSINEEFIYAVYEKKLFSDREAGGLIGLAYRINSANMIFTSDVMTNSGYVVPKNRVLGMGDSLYDYFQVCTHLSLFNYLEEYLFPYVKGKRPELTKQQFIARQSLKAITPYLKASAKFGVMANKNDLFMPPDELDYLQQTFRDRLKVYPTGGHLGNLEYRENVDYMISFLKAGDGPDGGR